VHGRAVAAAAGGRVQQREGFRRVRSPGDVLGNRIAQPASPSSTTYSIENNSRPVDPPLLSPGYTITQHLGATTSQRALRATVRRLLTSSIEGHFKSPCRKRRNYFAVSRPQGLDSGDGCVTVTHLPWDRYPPWRHYLSYKESSATNCTGSAYPFTGRG